MACKAARLSIKGKNVPRSPSEPETSSKVKLCNLDRITLWQVLTNRFPIGGVLMKMELCM